MIPPDNSRIIPVNVRGNGGEVAGTGLSTSISPSSVGILWETSRNLIILGSLSSDKKINVTAGGAMGNAVIAAYSGADCSGDILWSWHIWVTDYNPDETPVENGDVYTITNTSGSYIWMDRNLGAITVTPSTTTTLGLLYQWGRKDPFPGAGNYTGISNNTYTSLPIYNQNGTALTEESGTSGSGIKHAQALETTLSDKVLNLRNSIKSPMTFYYGVEGDNISYDWYTSTDNADLLNSGLWGSSTSESKPSGKTIFDPCPEGWRVPYFEDGISPWKSFDTGDVGDSQNSYIYFPWYSSAWESSYGRIYTESVPANMYYPATGFRYWGSGAFFLVGVNGNYWLASVVNSYSSAAAFSRSIVDPYNYSNRAGGFSVRCVKEK
jgi:hypothetical protein